MSKQNICLLMAVAVVAVVGLVTLQVGVPSFDSENIAGEAMMMAKSSGSSYAYATALNPATSTAESTATRTAASTTTSTTASVSSGAEAEASAAHIGTTSLGTQTIASTQGCVDSDGGDRPLTPGQILISEAGRMTVEKDSCQSSESMTEWFCVGSSPMRKKVNCGSLGGTCKTDSQHRAYCSKGTQCVDSDGGNKPLVAGGVSIITPGSEKAYPDICIGLTGLTEFVCGEGDRGATAVKVGVDCSSLGGICRYDTTGKPQAYCDVMPTTAEEPAPEPEEPSSGICADSDGHLRSIEQYPTPGQVTTDTGVFNDVCISFSKLNEQVCRGGVRAVGPIECPSKFPGSSCVTNAAGMAYCGTAPAPAAGRSPPASSAAEEPASAEEAPPVKRSRTSESDEEDLASEKYREEPRDRPMIPVERIAPAHSCSDSDRGMEPTVGGAVSIDGISIYDTCDTSANVVIEAYCDTSGRAQTKPKPCDEFGFVCHTAVGGDYCGPAEVRDVIGFPAGGSEVPGVPGVSPTCTDTDGGDELTVPGTVTAHDGTTRTDSCHHTGNLIEYTCASDGWYRGEGHLCTEVNPSFYCMESTEGAYCDGPEEVREETTIPVERFEEPGVPAEICDNGIDDDGDILIDCDDYEDCIETPECSGAAPEEVREETTIPVERFEEPAEESAEDQDRPTIPVERFDESEESKKESEKDKVFPDDESDRDVQQFKDEPKDDDAEEKSAEKTTFFEMIMDAFAFWRRW